MKFWILEGAYAHSGGAYGPPAAHMRNRPDCEINIQYSHISITRTRAYVLFDLSSNVD